MVDRITIEKLNFSLFYDYDKNNLFIIKMLWSVGNPSGCDYKM